jgi:hypothetical protein
MAGTRPAMTQIERIVVQCEGSALHDLSFVRVRAA